MPALEICCGVVLLLAARGLLRHCSGDAGWQHRRHTRAGCTVVMALPPAATPNWILPIGIPGYLASYNSAISRLLFQPLYRYHEVNGSLVLDEAADLADPPRYAEDGRTVTIPLRPGRKWTNGRAVSARDVQFWFDLIKANKTRWGGYSPGALPDNVTAAGGGGRAHGPVAARPFVQPGLVSPQPAHRDRGRCRRPSGTRRARHAPRTGPRPCSPGLRRPGAQAQPSTPRIHCGRSWTGPWAGRGVQHGRPGEHRAQPELHRR
ncbi:hypothetical protein BC739_009038 [Kutzneria viridogrisea]|uniref:Solute-binding protein family 5 domain-containing protein n=1 Tax=Kutzneria viridogrisea TaxID=47990 RepID=A0ABR6BXY8_9PSEU|nr:hypothetical protein [Kutzneria viridogrisea]